MLVTTCPPVTPIIGALRFDSTTQTLQYFTGSTWIVANMDVKPHYKILEGPLLVDGAPWYSIECSNEMQAWLNETYVHKVDYFNVNSLKGVWVDVPDRLLTMIKLKW
jgi:hypothetical protein